MFVDFHSVYERYSPDVYRFACYLCGDAGLAEEITQEAFVRAWVTPGKIRVGTVKAYLLMIVRNLYRVELKRRARHTTLNESVLDANANPQRTVDARFELNHVLVALHRLPEVDRAALLMHVQEKMPHAEIAAALGLSVSAVKVKIHRARMKLNQLLAERVRVR
jgi:RNA polymerase sigma-70 factor (ECF subfamily)